MYKSRLIDLIKILMLNVWFGLKIYIEILLTPIDIPLEPFLELLVLFEVVLAHALDYIF